MLDRLMGFPSQEVRTGKTRLGYGIHERFAPEAALEQDAAQVRQGASQMHDETRPLGAIDHAMVV